MRLFNQFKPPFEDGALKKHITQIEHVSSRVSLFRVHCGPLALLQTNGFVCDITVQYKITHENSKCFRKLDTRTRSKHVLEN